MERQALSSMCLSHHELESDVVIIIVIAVREAYVST